MRVLMTFSLFFVCYLANFVTIHMAYSTQGGNVLLLIFRLLPNCVCEPGAVYVQHGNMVSLGGTIVFSNNTAHLDGGERVYAY